MKNNLKYVAFLDILGMSSAIKKNADEAWGALSDLRGAETEVEQNYKIKYPPTGEFVQKRVYKRRFSDSIVLFTIENSPKDLYAIIFVASLIFCESLKKCVPMRCGITHGEFFFNPELDMFIGRPLVNAYELEGKYHFLGLMVDDYINGEREVLTKDKNNSIIIDYNLPTKNGSTQTAHVINWPTLFRPSVCLPIGDLEFYTPFESLFGKFVDLEDDVKKKYRTTVKFINDVI